MERLNLIPSKKERVVPVSINGKDVDLRFDASDRNVTMTILDLVDDISDFVSKGDELKRQDSSDAKKFKSHISALKEYMDENLALCKKCSEAFIGIFPEWKSEVGDNYIPIGTYQILLMMLVDASNKELDDRLNDEIKGER